MIAFVSALSGFISSAVITLQNNQFGSMVLIVLGLIAAFAYMWKR